MHCSLGLFLLTVVLLSRVQCMMLDDPCVIMPVGPTDQNTTMDVEADPGCRNGTFWWNYPRGNIRIHFKYETAPYLLVCLKDNAGGSSFKLYDVTSGNKIAMPSVPSDRSKEVCTSVHHYEVVILFEAPKIAYYVRLIDYRVQPIYPL